MSEYKYIVTERGVHRHREEHGEKTHFDTLENLIKCGDVLDNELFVAGEEENGVVLFECIYEDLDNSIAILKKHNMFHVLVAVRDGKWYNGESKEELFDNIYKDNYNKEKNKFSSNDMYVIYSTIDLDIELKQRNIKK